MLFQHLTPRLECGVIANIMRVHALDPSLQSVIRAADAVRAIRRRHRRAKLACSSNRAVVTRLSCFAPKARWRAAFWAYVADVAKPVIVLRPVHQANVAGIGAAREVSSVDDAAVEPQSAIRLVHIVLRIEWMSARRE